MNKIFVMIFKKSDNTKASALDTASRDTLHDVLTQEEEDKEQGGGDQRNGRHLHGDIDVTRRFDEGVTQTIGNQTVLVRIGNEVGPYVGIPRAHHLENGDRDQRGQGERDHDTPQILDVAGAVDLSGQIQLVGNLHEVLLEQIDVEDAHEEGHDQNGEGVHPIQIEDRLVVGNGKQLTGDHHGRQQNGKQRILALEFQAGKGKGGEHRDDKGENGGNKAHVDGVQEKAAQVCLGKCLGIVAENDRFGKQGRYRETVLVQRLERGYDHPIEGEEDHDGDDDQKSVDQRQANDLCHLGTHARSTKIYGRHHAHVGILRGRGRVLCEGVFVRHIYLHSARAGRYP